MGINACDSLLDSNNKGAVPTNVVTDVSTMARNLLEQASNTAA